MLPERSYRAIRLCQTQQSIGKCLVFNGQGRVDANGLLFIFVRESTESAENSRVAALTDEMARKIAVWSVVFSDSGITAGDVFEPVHCPSNGKSSCPFRP